MVACSVVSAIGLVFPATVIDHLGRFGWHGHSHAFGVLPPGASQAGTPNASVGCRSGLIARIRTNTEVLH